MGRVHDGRVLMTDWTVLLPQLDQTDAVIIEQFPRHTDEQQLTHRVRQRLVTLCNRVRQRSVHVDKEAMEG